MEVHLITFYDILFFTTCYFCFSTKRKMTLCLNTVRLQMWHGIFTSVCIFKAGVRRGEQMTRSELTVYHLTMREVTAEIRGWSLTQIFHNNNLVLQICLTLPSFPRADRLHPAVPWVSPRRRDGDSGLQIPLRWVWSLSGLKRRWSMSAYPGASTRAPDPTDEFGHCSEAGSVYGCQGSFGSSFFAVCLPCPQCACLVFSGLSSPVIRQ